MAYAAYYDVPPPLVDHPHQRSHQHQNLLQYIAHRPTRPDEHPNQPDVDFRDAIKEYLIEVEVPGIKQPSEVAVSWTGSRSLLITGTVARPEYSTPDASKEGEDPEHPHGDTTHVLVGERRLGPFRRYFNFPTDVEKVSVTLEAGLLKIRAPKKGYATAAAAKVDVTHDPGRYDLPFLPIGGI